MSGAKVTEAHRAKAEELTGHIRSHPLLGEYIAQALADAEQAEREAIIRLLEHATNEDMPIATIVAAIRARGTPTKEKADG